MPYGGTVDPMSTGGEFTGRQAAQWYAMLTAFTGPWTDWSGSVVWTGLTTNPVIGNGSITAKYIQAGSLVMYTGSIVPGSTTTFGSGGWVVNLPVTPSALAIQNILYPGPALCYDNSAAANRQSATASILSTTQLVFYASTGGIVTSAVPFTWAANDILGWTVIYQAA